MLIARQTKQYPSLFDRFLESNAYNWSSQGGEQHQMTQPAVNVRTSDKGFFIEIAAPSFEKADFSIEVNNDLLTIAGQKKKEEQSEANDQVQYTTREFFYDHFSRSFTLPESANDEKIKAEYSNGVLYVFIPRKETTLPKPKKQIDIL